MSDFSIANPFWQYNFPEYELEGLWTCTIQDVKLAPTLVGNTSTEKSNSQEFADKLTSKLNTAVNTIFGKSEFNPKLSDVAEMTYNNISVNSYMPLGFDKYIQSVDIPQISFNYKSTEFGLTHFEEKNVVDDVTLNFYDDIKGSCLLFFHDWMKLIYDESKNCLLPNWRYEAKDIVVTYYRALYTNFSPIKSYRMRKCLPKSIANINADESGEDRKTFSITLTCQRVIDLIKGNGPLDWEN